MSLRAERTSAPYPQTDVPTCADDCHFETWPFASQQIRAIACPTLVVTGEADVNAPPAAAERIVAAIPGAFLHLLPEVGHFPPFEVPDAFNAVLRAFLQDVYGHTIRS